MFLQQINLRRVVGWRYILKTEILASVSLSKQIELLALELKVSDTNEFVLVGYKPPSASSDAPHSLM